MKKQVVADYRISDTAVSALERLGYEVIPTVPIDALYDEVKGHADMQLHIAGGKAICAPEVYGYYKDKLSIPVICGRRYIGSKYPHDIAYNACAMGKYVVCCKAYTAPEILSEYVSLGKEILNTKQGYAKCSICTLNDKSAITADEGISSLFLGHGLNVLKVSPHDIWLYGMAGFIGGASGLLEQGLVAFNGDIRTHRDHALIETFCKNIGVDITCLAPGRLVDIGTIIRIP